MVLPASRDGILHFTVVAIGYGLLFAGLHAISFSHWAVFNGLRLAALLILPYRYWPAILLGEIGPLALDSLHHLDQGGVAWAFAHATPGCLIVMPAAYAYRKKPASLRHDALRVVDFLMCALVASVLLTAWNFATLAMTHLPPNFVMPAFDQLAGRWVLGNFLGILTLCPVLLASWDVLNRASPQSLAARIVHSRFLRECLGTSVPIAIAAVLYASRVPGEQQCAQIMMSVPVVALALRYGWGGAAMGGFVASTAIIVMMPALYDHDTLQAETLIAFVVSTMLMLGARITVLSTRLDQERKACRAKDGQHFNSGIDLGLQAPPDAVMHALLAAADAVLERHAQPRPMEVLLATVRECHVRLRHYVEHVSRAHGSVRWMG